MRVTYLVVLYIYTYYLLEDIPEAGALQEYMERLFQFTGTGVALKSQSP